MIECYSHLVDEDIDQEFARQAGIELADEKESGAPEPIICGGCHKVMPPGSRFCARCGSGLSQTAISDVKEAQEYLEGWISNHPVESIQVAQRLAGAKKEE